MLHQNTALLKCLITLSATDKSHCQHISLLKCLVTFGACKWLLSCVGLLMLLTTTALFEFLVTFGA